MIDEDAIWLDLMAQGKCFYKVEDGQVVRIDPADVYIRRPWYRRLWDRVYWWWWNLWLRR